MDVAHFGVELELTETNRNRQGDYLTMNDAGRVVAATVEKVGFKNRYARGGESPSTFNLKHDHCGPEITTPALKAGIQNIRRLARFVKELRTQLENLGFDPEKFTHHNAGIHVHLDSTGLTMEQKSNFLRVIWMFEPLFYKLCTAPRASSYWCSPVRRSTVNARRRRHPGLAKLESIKQVLDSHDFWDRGRGGAVRGRPHGHNKTSVEIRYSNATLDPDHMLNWILLLVTLMHIAINWDGMIDAWKYNKVTKEDLIKFISDESHVRKYKIRRSIPKLVQWLETRL